MKSRDELEKIFKRVGEQFQIDDVHIELATDRHTDGIIAFMKDSFVKDEPLSRQLRLDYDESMPDRLRLPMQDNLSIVLVSNTTDEVVGILITYFIQRGTKRNRKTISNDRSQILVDFLSQKDDLMSVFDRFEVDTVIRIAVFGVSKHHRKKGMGSTLLRAELAYYREIGVSPLVLKADCTSAVTCGIFRKQGFEVLHELPYDESKVDNEFIFRSVRHQGPALIVEKYENN